MRQNSGRNRVCARGGRKGVWDRVVESGIRGHMCVSSGGGWEMEKSGKMREKEEARGR